jgi:5'-nucleotidase
MDTKRPLILVVNDDGVTAPGIRTLIRLMKTLGEVVVVAPDSPQSGKGHAITLDSMLQAERVYIDEGGTGRICLFRYSC